MSQSASPIRPLIAGNWKMNGLLASQNEAEAVVAGLGGAVAQAPEVLICPPATLLVPFAAVLKGSQVGLGGQDCHSAASGAHTGDISAEMLVDAGATAVIVGHSERRADHGERSLEVRQKAEAAHRAGLTAIVCVGETIGERQAGLALTVVRRQVAASLPDLATAANTVVAYEPVWAIGTGRTPTAAEVAEVHGAIRASVSERFGNEGEAMRLLYGGSVKPGNARELLAVANVNGALVGGASLNAADFLAIIAACG